MAFSQIFSAHLSLLQGQVVRVEVDIARGLHQFTIVGLADKAISEARERVSASLKNSGYDSPKSANEKITISLSPASIKKEGSQFDLAIAVGYFLAKTNPAFTVSDALFIGELTLDGIVQKVSGTLPIAHAAKKAGITKLYLPTENAPEAALIDDITIYPVQTLKQLIAHLSSKNKSETITPYTPPSSFYEPYAETDSPQIDLADIHGHETAKRGLLIAAAGKHNVLLFGPPGTGKTMLANSFSSILPPLSHDELIEVLSIQSVRGHVLFPFSSRPPFRNPHHTSSFTAVIGGGNKTPQPGEITFAHHGVLFLDEFPEFDRRVLESLRQPLEENCVRISRSKETVSFPAHIILVAAMNPCPCGFRGSPHKSCSCSASDLLRYKKKLSGPLLDRIDISLSVQRVPTDTALQRRPGISSSEAQEKIIHARTFIQTHTMSCTPEAIKILSAYIEKRSLSLRSFYAIKKIAHTIAALESSNIITPAHILEAASYRPTIESIQ